MAFFGLFETAAEKEQKQRTKDAQLERATDLGRRMSQTVVGLIDTFFDEKVMPLAIKANADLVHDMETHHHDATTDEAMNLLVTYRENLEVLKENAVTDVWDVLGEWKYNLMEAGLKGEFDRYIAQKFDPVWETSKTIATEQMAYCAARITGHVTDEMHAMTPDELKEYVRSRDSQSTCGK
jgi:hypothetical protein